MYTMAYADTGHEVARFQSGEMAVKVGQTCAQEGRRAVVIKADDGTLIASCSAEGELKRFNVVERGSEKD
jgi:spermidine synthase